MHRESWTKDTCRAQRLFWTFLHDGSDTVPYWAVNAWKMRLLHLHRQHNSICTGLVGAMKSSVTKG